MVKASADFRLSKAVVLVWHGALHADDAEYRGGHEWRDRVLDQNQMTNEIRDSLDRDADE